MLSGLVLTVVAIDFQVDELDLEEVQCAASPCSSSVCSDDLPPPLIDFNTPCHSEEFSFPESDLDDTGFNFLATKSVLSIITMLIRHIGR